MQAHFFNVFIYPLINILASRTNVSKFENNKAKIVPNKVVIVFIGI